MGLLTLSSPPHMILAAHLLLLQVSLLPSQHIFLSFSSPFGDGCGQCWLGPKKCEPQSVSICHMYFQVLLQSLTGSWLPDSTRLQPTVSMPATLRGRPIPEKSQILEVSYYFWKIIYQKDDTIKTYVTPSTTRGSHACLTVHGTGKISGGTTETSSEKWQ